MQGGIVKAPAGTREGSILHMYTRGDRMSTHDLLLERADQHRYKAHDDKYRAQPRMLSLAGYDSRINITESCGAQQKHHKAGLGPVVC